MLKIQYSKMIYIGHVKKDNKFIVDIIEQEIKNEDFSSLSHENYKTFQNVIKDMISKLSTDPEEINNSKVNLIYLLLQDQAHNTFAKVQENLNSRYSQFIDPPEHYYKMFYLCYNRIAIIRNYNTKNDIHPTMSFYNLIKKHILSIKNNQLTEKIENKRKNVLLEAILIRLGINREEICQTLKDETIKKMINNIYELNDLSELNIYMSLENIIKKIPYKKQNLIDYFPAIYEKKLAMQNTNNFAKNIENFLNHLTIIEKIFFHILNITLLFIPLIYIGMRNQSDINYDIKANQKQIISPQSSLSHQQ